MEEFWVFMGEVSAKSVLALKGMRKRKSPGMTGASQAGREFSS
jgi:hypothetical protein